MKSTPSKTESQHPARLIGVTAENVKRIELVELHIGDQAVTVIGGRNEQGKTSLIDAVEMGLRGKSAMPKNPVRKGAKSGRIVLEIADGKGDLIVERRMGAEGQHTLTVKNREGLTHARPQEVLDRLYNACTVDPLTFSRMKPADQRVTLMTLAGLNFDDLDRRRQTLFAQRTETNREVQRLDAQMQAKPRVTDAPKEPVSVGELMGKRREMEAVKQANADARRAAGLAKTSCEQSDQQAQRISNDITRVQAEIKRLQDSLVTLDKQLEDQNQVTQTLAKKAKELADNAAALIDPDFTAIDQQIASADATNAKVRQNREHDLIASELNAERKQAEKMTADIEAIDAEKAAKLKAAKLPIEGLGLSDDGVTYKGIAFEECSAAERLRVSVAMALALNPQLKLVLIRNGSDLDADNLRLIGEMATEAGAVVLLERVGEGAECSVVIEAGRIKAEEPAEVAAS